MTTRGSNYYTLRTDRGITYSTAAFDREGHERCLLLRLAGTVNAVRCERRTCRKLCCWRVSDEKKLTCDLAADLSKYTRSKGQRTPVWPHAEYSILMTSGIEPSASSTPSSARTRAATPSKAGRVVGKSRKPWSRTKVQGLHNFALHKLTRRSGGVVSGASGATPAATSPSKDDRSHLVQRNSTRHRLEEEQ